MISQAKAHLARLLPKSQFARSVGVLVGGTASAQLLLILAAPLLTRLYSPDDFGLLAVYAGLLSIIAVIASLRYELAIPLPESDQDAAHVVALSLLIVAAMTIVSGVIVFFFGEVIAAALGVPRLTDYFWLLPLGVFLTGTYQVFNYWAIRTKQFSTVSGTRMRQALVTIAIQLLGFKAGGVALLLGQAGGQGAGTFRLGKHALAWSEFRQITWAGTKQTAERYRRFPTFTTWAGLINTAGHQLPPIMFAALFSVGTAGLYALAHRVLMLPVSLIGSAIGNVFLSHAAKASREKKLDKLYLKLQDILVQIGFPPALVLIILGPGLFASIFGEEWRPAGEFSQWLAFGVFGGFIASPLSVIFSILEKQHIGLILQAFLFSIRVLSIAIGAWVSSLALTVALFSVASLVGYSLYIYMMSKYVGTNLVNLWRSMLKGGGCAVIAVLPIGASLFFDSGASIYIAICATTLIVLARYASIVKSASA